MIHLYSYPFLCFFVFSFSFFLLFSFVLTMSAIEIVPLKRSSHHCFFSQLICFCFSFICFIFSFLILVSSFSFYLHFFWVQLVLLSALLRSSLFPLCFFFLSLLGPFCLLLSSFYLPFSYNDAVRLVPFERNSLHNFFSQHFHF